MASQNTKKLIGKVLFLCLIVYTVYYATMFGLRFILGTESPEAVVEGISMEKTLFDGDLVIIQGVANKSIIQQGRDIIVYHNPYQWDILIVHRVVNSLIIKNKLYFRTLGDNNHGIIDPFYIPAENVVGVVIWKIPAFGYFVIFNQSLIGKFTVIFIIICNAIITFFSKDK